MNLSEIGFRGLYRNFIILQLTERLKCLLLQTHFIMIAISVILKLY